MPVRFLCSVHNEFCITGISDEVSQIAPLVSSVCWHSCSIVCEMPSMTVELSWWQLEVLLTAAWLMTMYITFRAGLRYQQFRMSSDDQVTVDEAKKTCRRCSWCRRVQFCI